MIVCTGCGNANEARSEFCGSCGAYLEWHGERVGTDPPPVAPPPVVVPTPERPGLLDRVRYVVGLDDAPPGTPPPGPVPHPPGPYSPPPGPAPYPPAPYPPAPYPPAPYPPAPPPAPAPPGAPSWPPAPPTGHALATPPGAPPPFGFTAGRPPLPTAPPAPPIGAVAGSARVIPAAPVYPTAPVSPAVGLGARAPEAEYERPPAQRPDPVDLGPADLYCGSCGAGNTDGRLFCRRCGTSLADAHRPPRLPWWKRIFRSEPKPRPSTSLAAGQRPGDWAKLSLTPESASETKPKRTWRFPRRIVVSRFALPLIGLSVIGMGLGPMRAKATEVVFDVYHGAKRKVAPEYVHVTPKSARATDAAKDHPASAAIDRNTTTYWSDGRTGTGAGSILTIDFDRPVELVKVGFDNGAAGKEFPFQPRLRVVEVTYLDAGTVVTRKQLTLGDKPEFQTFDLLGKRVDQATVRVVSVYAGQRGSAASLAELAFVTVQ